MQIMFIVFQRFIRLVRERRLKKFLREESWLKEVVRHTTRSGTFYFALFKTLPISLENTIRKRAFVTAREVHQQTRTPPGEIPISPRDWERLCNSYSLMKSEIPDDPTNAYFVGGLWEEWDSNHQSHLARALMERDFEALSSMFSRIGADKASMGVSLSGDTPGGFLGTLALANRLNSYLAVYASVYPGKEIARYPAGWGSFPGALKEGGVLIPSAPRMSHNARRLHNLLAVTSPEGHILEIGGGFGGVPFHLGRELDFKGTYSNFDIPEVLIISAAFLIAVMPKDSVFLYGDDDALRSRPIKLFPHYKLPEIRPGAVDVIFNSHSLTEMNFSTVREYLDQINRIQPLFFLHMNHEYGSRYKVRGDLKAHAVVGPSGLDLPAESFRRIFRAPEILTNDGAVFGSLDYWENLYMRVRD